MNSFTTRDDHFLAQYIAKYCPTRENRCGNRLYEKLVENEEKKWPWAKRHTFYSWRNRYVKNQAYFDKKIARYVQAPAMQPRPPPPAVPAASSSEKQRKRADFTAEDDEHLVEALANRKEGDGTLRGTKLYRDFDEKYPWAAAHPWQSWQERYKKNAAWYDWAVRGYLADGDFDEPEPIALRPKTVKHPLYRRATPQPKSAAAAPSKRPRTSDAGDEAPPPKKKSRAQEGTGPKKSRENVAGPSRLRQVTEASDDENVPAADAPLERVVSDEPRGGGGQALPAIAEKARDVTVKATAVAEEEEEEEEEEEGSEEEIVVEDEEEEDEAETSAEGSEESDVEMGPIGSDDYRGEINLRDDNEEAASVQEPQSRTDSSDEEDEAKHILTDDPLPPGDDANAEMEQEWVVDDEGPTSVDVAQNVKPPDTAEPPILSNTPPSGASPPRRRLTMRIQRDIDADPSTSDMSPLVEAEARHHLERDHSPGPPRKHVKRISRSNEDIFGTPEPSMSSTSASATAENSPTVRHVAHRRESQPDVADLVPVSTREPPRLDEGAWNKAFSDVKGKPRVEPTRKSRRPSGVNFEDEAKVIGVQEEPEGAASASEPTSEEEDADPKTPQQWPPPRSKHKPAAVSTPVHSRDARASRDLGSGRVITTEKTITVKTTRTIERRVPRASKGTPFPRAIAAAAIEAPSSPAQPADDSIQVEEIEGSPSQHHPFSQAVEPTQHHPFSQPLFAPSISTSTSAGSSGSGSGQRQAPRVDPARLAKMLEAGRATEGKVLPQASPSKAERDAKHPKAALIPPVDRARLQRLLNDAGKPDFRALLGSRQAPSSTNTLLARATMSPPSGGDDANRFDQFEERDQELPVPHSSPLSHRQDPQRQPMGELPPPIPAREAASVTPQAAGPSNAHARRYTLTGPPTPDVFQQRSSSRPRSSRPRSPFAIGDLDLSRRTALSLLFHPPRSGSGQPRSYTLPRPSSASPVPAACAEDAAFADTLSVRERELVKALGVQVAVQTMALNHGFSEDTVRKVCAEAGSLEAADHVLRRMRDSANEVANEELSSIAGDGMDVEDDEPEEKSDDEPAKTSEGDASHSRRYEEAAVEDALMQDEWLGLGDEPPLAESSRVVRPAVPAQQRVSSSSGVSAHAPRRSEPLKFQLASPEPESGDEAEYSPPKRSRAAAYAKKRAKAQVQEAAMDASPRGEATPGSAGASEPAKKPNPPAKDPDFGDLLKYDRKQWQQLGAKGAKSALGKALGKLL